MTKRYLIQAAGFNLSLVIRQILGAGTPREVANRHWALKNTLHTLFPCVLAGLNFLFGNMRMRSWSELSGTRSSFTPPLETSFSTG